VRASSRCSTMQILHPYSEDRPQDKAETLRFLDSIRDRFEVVDFVVHRSDYPIQLSRHWGRDDIIILEDDKVPTVADLEELAACPKGFCIFPYPSRDWVKTTVKDWQKHTPYGLGFAKFSLEVQKEFPSDGWDWSFRPTQCDRIIEKDIIAKRGPMHLHPTMIKHNHGPQWHWWLLDLVRGH